MTIDELGHDLVRLTGQVDDLATTTQQEFATIRREFAAVHDEVRGVLRAVQTFDLHVSGYTSRWGESSKEIRRQFHDLDCRVRLLEKGGA